MYVLQHSMDTLLRAGYLTEEIWSYGSGPDEVVFSVDSACQLLGVGLCGTNGSIKVDMEICQVSGPLTIFAKTLCSRLN